MKSPIELLIERRDEIQREYERVKSVQCEENGYESAFEKNKMDDLNYLQGVIDQYNGAVFVLSNPTISRLF